jgi:hypothetical protein
MVVTCPLGMSIPASPVSEHNPVLSADGVSIPTRAAIPAANPLVVHPALTWFKKEIE